MTGPAMVMLGNLRRAMSMRLPPSRRDKQGSDSMSHDGWLMIDTGGPEHAEVAELGNYTSNVSRMWAKALAAAGEDIFLADTHGRLAGDVLPLLRRAVDHMGGYRYLRGVAEACERHPRAYLSWWV